MAHTFQWFGRALEGQFSATAARRVDWTGDTIKVALTTNTYAPDQDAHDFFNDVTNEITGTGYTAGGLALASKTVVYDTATNQLRLDAADSAWGPGATLAAIRKAIVYKDTGTPATSPLLGYITFDADQAVTNGTFTIQYDANGLLVATAA